MSVNIDNVNSILEFNEFLTNCSDTVLILLANEVNYLHTNSYFPESGICLQLLDRINDSGNTATAMDICIPIALEYLHRHCVPF